MRTAIFDIETTGFSAVGAGILLCVVIKEFGGRSKTFRYDEFGNEPGNDRKMLQAVVKELKQYDLLVGHFIEGFDLPWLRSRCLIKGVPFDFEPLTYDTFRAAKRCKLSTEINAMGKHTAKLSFLADFLGIKQQKTSIYPREWWNSVWEKGEKRQQAMKYIVDHCEKDVVMNSKVYEALLAMDKTATIKRWR